MGTVPVPGRKSAVKMLGLTIFLLVISLSSSLPVKRQAEYEYEYEDVLDEHGNVVYDYDYVLTEVPVHQTNETIASDYEYDNILGGYPIISNGAINQNTGPTGKIITIVTKKKRTRKIKIKKNKACHKRFINQ